MNARHLGCLFIAAAMIVACSSSDDDSDTTSYSGDPLEAIKSGCERDFATDAICDGYCMEARLNMKCSGSDKLTEDPGFHPYIDCRNACPAAKTCPASGARAEIPFADCDCLTKCAAKQSKRFQGYLAYDSDCVGELDACH